MTETITKVHHLNSIYKINRCCKNKNEYNLYSQINSSMTNYRHDYTNSNYRTDYMNRLYMQNNNLYQYNNKKDKNKSIIYDDKNKHKKPEEFKFTKKLDQMQKQENTPPEFLINNHSRYTNTSNNKKCYKNKNHYND